MSRYGRSPFESEADVDAYLAKFAKQTERNRPKMKKATLPQMTEKAFQAAVIKLAKLNGWREYHTWKSIHSPAGFPDLVLVRGGTLVFAELKTDKPGSKLSDEQAAWMRALLDVAAGKPDLHVYLWRPSDMDEIIEMLR